MNYSIEVTDNFKKEAKRLVKKYPSLVNEISQLGLLLASNPTYGISLGDDVYKIRLSVASKNKGKSGGARVITYVKILNTTVYLLSIYSKGEQASISTEEIKELLSNYI